MTAVARPPGRPRDPGADHAILDASLDVLREHGFGGFTVDAVAARAGVGKATIRAFVLSSAMVLVADYLLWMIIF